MFSIYLDDKILYSSDLYAEADTAIIQPSCSVEIGKAGSLSFTLLPNHYLYNEVKSLTSVVRAFYMREEIFTGRVLQVSKDVHRHKSVQCEGNLTFFLDSIFPPLEEKMTVRDFFIMCVAAHNEQVEPAKQFSVGIVNAKKADNNEVFSISGFADTKSTMDDSIINAFGGYFRTRVSGDRTYVDYLKDYGVESNQILEFGENIIDYMQEEDANDIFTVLLPIGDIVQIEGGGANDRKITTIAPVNNGSTMINLSAGMSKYGRIVRTESFSGVTDPAELMEKAQQYIEDNYKDPPMTLTIGAVDLKLFDWSLDMFQVGAKYRVVSRPHNIDRFLTCTQIKYNMADIGATVLTLSDPKQRVGGSSFRPHTGQALSSAIGSSSGGRGGGSGGKAWKHITEGEDWVKIAAKKIDLIGEDITLMAGDLNTQGTQISLNKERILLEAKARSEENEELRGAITVESNRITAEVTNRTDAFNTLEGRINVEADKITAEVTRSKGAEELLSGRLTITERNIALEVTNRTDAFSTLQGRINVEANKITAEVSRASQAEGTLSSRITQTAESIELKVDKNGVVNAINVSSEGVKISTAKLNVSGIISAGGIVVEGDLSAIRGDFQSLITGRMTASSVNITNLNASKITTGYVLLNGINVETSLNNIYVELSKKALSTHGHGRVTIDYVSGVTATTKTVTIDGTNHTFLTAIYVGAKRATPYG